MQKIEFLVKGSASEPYRVTIENRNNSVAAYCTCAAAENGTFCKHRVRILQGSEEGIVSGNTKDIQVAMNWLKGSELEKVILSIETKEKELEATKKVIQDLKKKLSRLLIAA